jgi:hypothetical protein
VLDEIAVRREQLLDELSARRAAQDGASEDCKATPSLAEATIRRLALIDVR